MLTHTPVDLLQICSFCFPLSLTSETSAIFGFALDPSQKFDLLSTVFFCLFVCSPTLWHLELSGSDMVSRYTSRKLRAGVSRDVRSLAEQFQLLNSAICS